MTQEVHVFAPATVANVACGFDTLGFAIRMPGDTVVARFVEQKGLRIKEIVGDGGKLSKDIEKNTATVAALAYMEALNIDRGIELDIHKGLPIGSGLGSSAASAVGGVMAVNELLGRPLSKKELLPFALKGEAIASGGAIHADNVAPCLMGGIELVRSNKDLDTINIMPPKALFAAVVLPNIEILTVESRAVLRKEIPMSDAITQWGNLAALIAGFMKEDYGLIGRSLVDVIAEPYRSKLIPGFDKVKQAALDAGALGCSISGAGPAIFALCEGDQTAFEAGEGMQQAFQSLGVACERYISPINTEGAIRLK
ncbi:MAG: homoserine kinase [Bacteroidia bacterium]